LKPEEPHIDLSDDGISRRRMLKRIGAGAAVAWSAPILTSIRSPAFAQGSPTECGVPGIDCFTCDIRELDCNGDPLCGCVPTQESDCFCIAPQSCAGLQPCNSSSECPAGTRCANSCCGEPLCLVGCGGGQKPRSGRGRNALPRR
jgi:hypothetical protein